MDEQQQPQQEKKPRRFSRFLLRTAATLVVLAVGLLLVVPLQGVLQNPTISTATSYILPALFGCMALGILGRGAGPMDHIFDLNSRFAQEA